MTQNTPTTQAGQKDKKAALLAKMEAIPKPTEEQVKIDTQAAADGSYKNKETAQQETSACAEAMDGKAFLARLFPPKGHLLGPVLQERDLAMLFALRGTGKTLFTMQIAIALAGGGSFLKWQATSPCKVLYVDGEMPGALLQSRVANALKWATDTDKDAALKNLAIITPDIQQEAMPNLSGPKGQAWIMPAVEQADFIVFDSLLTLCPYGRSNEAESFLPMQEFMLALRKKGKAVLLIHHAGKGGDQLGTITKETVLDTVFKLAPANESGPQDGTRFELSYPKHRNFWGEDANPLDITLQNGIWSFQDGVASLTEKIREMAEDLGMTQKEIAAELKINQSKVSRTMKKHGFKKKCGLHQQINVGMKKYALCKP